MGSPKDQYWGLLCSLCILMILLRISELMKFVLFADDTNIICSGNNLEQLLEQITEEMDKLKSCFNVNKLSLNLKKTKFILFGKRKHDNIAQITIDNTRIERVKQNVF